MKLFLVVVTGAAVFATLPAQADQNQQVYRTNGYSILHHLCEQEKPLEMILMVKTTPKDVADFAHEVSKAAGANADLLEDLREHDKSIRFDETGLPQFEDDTRESIRGDKQHMLLFTDSGPSFARALLVTQIEAGTYGMNLAKVLADAETNSHRAAVVRKVGASFERIRDKAYRLLNGM